MGYVLSVLTASWRTTNGYSGCFKVTDNHFGTATGGNSDWSHVWMDASWSNEIYGSSDSVTPLSLKACMFIRY